MAVIVTLLASLIAVQIGYALVKVFVLSKSVPSSSARLPQTVLLVASAGVATFVLIGALLIHGEHYDKIGRFAVDLEPFNKLIGLVVMSVAMGGLIYVMIGYARKRALSDISKHEEVHFQRLFGIGEVALLFVGVVVAAITAGLAITAIEKNTQSNLATCRAQLYQNENEILSREYEEAGGILWVIYADPPEAKVKDADAYWNYQLRAISVHSDFLAQASSAAAVYELMYGYHTRTEWDGMCSDEKQAIVDLRKISTHITLVLDQMHSAFDYQEAGVISEEEFKTWKGYITDVGPHPVMLATLLMWKDQNYMSAKFATEIRQSLIDTKENKKWDVIRKFYPDLENQTEFIAGLPNYPRRTSRHKD